MPSDERQQRRLPIGGPGPGLTPESSDQELEAAPEEVAGSPDLGNAHIDRAGPSEPAKSKRRVKRDWRRFSLPEVPVPSKGIKGIFWKLIGSRIYTYTGWDFLATLSWRERERRVDKELRANRKVQSIIAFANKKGGSGKTTLCTLLSALFAKVVNRNPVAFDANEGGGGTAGRLGVDREDTMTLRRFLKRCFEGEFESNDEFLAAVGYHSESGVSVISSEEASNEDFSKVRFQFALHTSKRNSHSVFADLGNNNKSAANLGSCEMADVLIFVGNPRMPDSLDDLESTRAIYAELGLPRKVSNGLIVIVGAKQRQRKQFAERFNVPIERLFVLPYERALAQETYTVQLKRGYLGMEFWKISRSLRVVLKEILAAALKAERVPEETSVYYETKYDEDGSKRFIFVKQDKLEPVETGLEESQTGTR